jgi:hypothetical protein
MSLDLKNLQAQTSYFDATGRPTLQMQMFWQDAITAIKAQDAAQDSVIDALAAAVAAITAAQDAADLANAAAANAQSVADNVTSSQSLGTSYVSGATISAADAGTDATITISAHTRHYPQPDGTTVDVAVSGGSVTGLAYSTYFYVYYDDAARAGGAVTYFATVSDATAAQIGDRHVVGATSTPAALGSPTSGGSTRPPGSGSISKL